MSRSSLLGLSVIVCVFLAGAETISLSGIVKKTGGTSGIPGVKVSIVNIPDISGTTGTDGKFHLSGSTSSVISRKMSNEPIRYMIKGNTIVFAPTLQRENVRVVIFSSQGKVLSSMQLSNRSAVERSLTLPRLSDGIAIMRVTAGAQTFTRALICVGRTIITRNESLDAAGDRLILAKRLAAAPVDTIVAEKAGYITKKVPIEKYNIDNISITLDSSAADACTREALKVIADQYLAAQKDGDPLKLPLASTVTYIQNNKTITAEKCVVNTAMTIDNSIHFFDVDSCRIFTEIISATGTVPRVLVTWLKVDGGKVSEIDAIISSTGDFQFNATKYLNYTKDQDWTVLPAAQRSSREQLIKGADAYLDMFKGTSGDDVPWGSPCARVEGGNMYVSPDCIVGMPGHGGMGTVNITDRRYAVDLDMGTVDVFCSFGGTMPDSHMFRLIDGKIRLVHTLSIQKN